MNHHIQLMISCKGDNCIIASKCTRLCQTGHCKEMEREWNEVFTMEKSKCKKQMQKLVFILFQIMRTEGIHLKSPLALSESRNLAGWTVHRLLLRIINKGLINPSLIKDSFIYSFNKYLLNASYMTNSIKDTGNVTITTVIIIVCINERLCVKRCSTHFSQIITFNLQNNILKEILCTPSYRWVNRGTEQFITVPKVTEPVHSRAAISSQATWLPERLVATPLDCQSVCPQGVYNWWGTNDKKTDTSAAGKECGVKNLALLKERSGLCHCSLEIISKLLEFPKWQQCLCYSWWASQPDLTVHANEVTPGGSLWPSAVGRT